MIRRIVAAAVAAHLLLPACGGPETAAIPQRPSISGDEAKCPYVWHTDDDWSFLAWAVMGSDEHADALCLGSGFAPGTAPRPGDTVMLPLSPAMGSSLRARLAAARLVRRATEAREADDRTTACSLLLEARRADAEWSVPVYDLALMYIEDGALDAARDLLEPLSHKYRVAWLLSWIAWSRGRMDEALKHIQTALMDPDPPPEVLLSAGIIYSIHGDDYQAGRMWNRVLSDPAADSRLRLQALRWALGGSPALESPGSLRGAGN